MAEEAVEKILKIMVDYGDALNKIAQYKIEIEKLKEQQKQLKKELKDGNITQQEYQVAMEQSRQVVSRLSTESGVYQKQISNQIKVQREQEGSLVQMRAKLSDLTAEYDRLSKADRDAAKGVQLKKQINELTTELKNAEEATQRYYRNVGNYPKTMASLGEQLDIYVVQLKEMQAAHKEGTPEFEAMAEKAEKLRETLATASEGGKTSMNDLSNNIANLGMGFLAWGEILDRAGLKNAECEKTLSQMMVVITAAGTAMKIYNAVQKEGAVYTAALQVKAMLLNTSLGKYIATRAAATTAEAAGTTATGAASTATSIFNAVLYANPLVWLIGIIVAATAAIYGLVKAFQWFTSSSEEQKKAVAEEAKELENLQQQMEQTRAQMAAMGATSEEIMNITITNNKTMYENYCDHFDKVAELYDEDDDEYKEALEAKENAFKEFQQSLEDGYESLLKVSSEQHEWELKEALGEYEYKRTLINEQAEQQLKMAKILLENNKINAQEYARLEAAIKSAQARKIADVDKSEKEANAKAVASAKKSASDAAKARADEAKKAAEEEKKREEEYQKEFQAAQDALVAIMKAGLDKQQKIENLAYERQMKALQDKIAKVQADTKSSEEYKLKMIAEINTQIEALTAAHEQRLSDLTYQEEERRLKIKQEMLQAQLDHVKKGTEEEMNLRKEMLERTYEMEQAELKKRLDDGLLTQEQYDFLKEQMALNHTQQVTQIDEEYSQLSLDRQRERLQQEIDTLQLAEDERELRRMEGYEMDEQHYAEWRQRNLDQMDEHQREIFLKQEEAAQAEYDALVARGQLSTQTTEQYEAELLAAKQKSMQAQKATNDQIIKNEQAKAQAMKAVTSSLTGLLDTLGESNAAFAKMSKIITLAQIAIDTGKALSAGIASASSMPFPANIAAIATTVATVLANITTAIQTVKSAKFAQGGKVTGPGTGTSDSIPAMLSNGEYVMTAKATRLYEPLLMAMNNIGSGVPMQVMNSNREYENTEALTESFSAAAQEIRPVVSVVEISEAQDRVTMIENLDTF